MKVVLQSGGGAASFEDYIVKLPPGATVFCEGDVGTEMFVIQSGSVEIAKRVKEGLKTLAVLEKGDFFGEMSILEDVPRTADAITRTDVELVKINQSTFDEMLRHNGEIAVRMLRKLSRRLRETTALLEQTTGVAPALDEIDAERLLVDRAGLADVGVVEPDEVGAFARDVGEQHLVADESRRRRGDQLVEVRLRPARVPRARVSGNRAHCSPPKTSMFENLHAGDACPVPISWLSSPLPQFGVPITVKLLRSATPVRLRQKVEEIPR